MAKKKSEKKIVEMTELTAIEALIKNGDPVVVDVAIKMEEVEQIVHIKQHISGDIRGAIMEQVEAMFYPAGIYDPEHGETVLDFILFQMYTDLTFEDNMDCFERFRLTEHYDVISEAFSPEYYILRNAAYKKANALKDVYFAPIEQTAMYASVKNVSDMLSSVLDGLDVLIQKTSKDIDANGGINIKEMFDALQMMKGKDEKKIAKAVLDYQEAKAKKAEIPEEPKPASKPVLHL